MSIDGPGIIESDLAHDVYSKVLDLYDAGVPNDDIRARVASLEEELTDDLELEIYLAASAKAFWEIGHLHVMLHTRLSQLIESGTSLALWAQTGDEVLAKARTTALRRLLRQITSPRPKPRPRKKYPIVRTKLYSVGDCLELRAETKTYRGVVCKLLEYRGQCEYAILVMDSATASTAESFVLGRYYGRRIPTTLRPSGFILGPHVIRPEHRMLVRAHTPFKVLGHVELDESKFILGSFGGVLEMSHVVDDFERTQTKATVFNQELLPLRDLLQKHSSTEA
jgi:hypothetical protein